MKKLGIMIIALSVMSMALSAQEFRVSAGVGAGIVLNSQTFNGLPFNMSGGSSTPFLGFDAFCDLTYATISVGYLAQLATASATGPVAAYSSQFTNAHFGYLTLRVVGKYPFQLADGFALFPMVGLEYDLLAASDQMSTYSTQTKQDASDLFLVLGLGGDIDLTKDIYLRISADFDLNLTATPTNPYPGSTYSGFNINGGVSVGFRF